jgi:hypothetical protein
VHGNYTATFLFQSSTNSMEQRPWEYDSCSAGQEIPTLLWNSRFHHHVPRTLSWPRLIQSTPFHLCQDLPCGLFMFFKLKFCMRVSSSPMYATCCISPSLIWSSK